MAHTMDGDSHTHRDQRTLRREVPSTVALVADERDFAAMRRYRSFTFEDHQHYLRQMEKLLRSLTSQGVHVTVTLFDPDEYAEYCGGTGQDPDSPATRTRYTAEVASGGPTVPYTRQPLDQLISQLEYASDRQAIWEYASALLARSGGCADCGSDNSQTAFDRASQILTRLLDAVGPGSHHLVCSVPVDDQPLSASLHARCDDAGHAHLVESEALAWCTVLAAGIATGRRGGVVLRTATGDGTDEVRGWTLHDGWLDPLTEAQVFNAYCTDAESGDPVPPEPGVVHRPGIALERPPDAP